MRVGRIGLIAFACAVAVITFVLVLVLTSLGESTDETKKVNDKLETVAPISPEAINELGEKIDDLATLPDQILPDIQVTLPPLPTLLQGPPGPAGEAGSDGQDGQDGTDGRTVTVRPQTPTPAQPNRPSQPNKPASPKPSPQPTCLLGGIARIGTIC